MNGISLDNQQETGAYSIPTAALYISATTKEYTGFDVSARHLHRWTRDGLAGGYLYGVKGRSQFINFLDLISLRLIAIMRANGMKHKDIQMAQQQLAERYDCDYPFARLELWTSLPKDIFVKEAGTLLSANRHFQAAMDIFEGSLKPMRDLDFSIFNEASSWRPHENVIFDPQVQDGEPCLRGTRVSTQVLWAFNQAGDSVDTLSRFYGLPPKRIQDAIDWEKRIQEASKN